MSLKLLYTLFGIVVLLAIIGNAIPDRQQARTQNYGQNTPALVTTPGTITADPITIGAASAGSQTSGVAPSISETIRNIFTSPATNTTKGITSATAPEYTYYPIVRVVDGDTVKINVDGQEDSYRLIGMNTPETVDPRKTVECFGVEASNKAKELLSGKKVRIETDPTQGMYDKYGRRLAYIYLEDGLFFNKYMIEQGYAHEYTYNIPYKYQIEFKNAENTARASQAGLWSPNTCNGDTASNGATSQNNTTDSCTIKGNISANGEKIYHMIGCGSYNQAVIDETKGEKWFCSEKEAIDAGWRQALNCF